MKKQNKNSSGYKNIHKSQIIKKQTNILGDSSGQQDIRHTDLTKREMQSGLLSLKLQQIPNDKGIKTLRKYGKKRRIVQSPYTKNFI